MRASNLFRLSRMQGALLGSFFLHALLLYCLARPTSPGQESSLPQKSVLHVQLMPQASTNTLTTTSSPTSAEVPLPQALAQPALPKEASPAQPPVQSDTAQSLVPWQPQEAKVTQFPELPFPADTVNVTAFLEIEVSLDKEGKATHVRVVRESPQAMFTEWVWEMGMKGQYKPRVTSAGPVESKLRVRIDIAPGMPLEVR